VDNFCTIWSHPWPPHHWLDRTSSAWPKNKPTHAPVHL